MNSTIPHIREYFDAMKSDNEFIFNMPAGDTAVASEKETPAMLCVENDLTDAYFNMAAEEYIIKHFATPVFMLYQNEPCVIIGRHQYVEAEVNMDFVRKKQIKVVRRNSGGGAVYQDYGNLNLTFMDADDNPGFDKYTKQMQHLLSTIGIQAQADERRALFVDGLKISGSAQYMRGNKILYHATLLFSSDLASMAKALDGQDIDPENLGLTEQKRYVKSVKSRVTNIQDYLPPSMTLRDFKKYIIEYFMGNNKNNRIYRFSSEDLRAIADLRQEKYAAPAWNLQDGL